VLTQTAHGLFSGDVEPAAARSLAYICQIAASTLPRPYRAPKPVDEGKPVITEPVTEITTGPDGHPLGPKEKYVGPGVVFEPYWSFTKYLYEQQCEALGKPKPTCVEDMPLSGWMGEEEYTEDPNQWTARYRAKIDSLQEEKNRRGAQAGRPVPHKRPRCSQGNVVCAGPEGLPRCDECDQIAWQKIEKEEEEEARARANNPDQPIGDLEAVASPAPGCSMVIKLAIPPISNIPNTCYPAAPPGGTGSQPASGIRPVHGWSQSVGLSSLHGFLRRLCRLALQSGAGCEEYQ